MSARAPAATLAGFACRFVPATVAGATPLLLLHGTGGDENDLIDLGRAVAPGAALLAPRGKVMENGMPRFFRRFAEGRFDEADVVAQAGALAAFVAEARKVHDLAAPMALGFSNGANIAAAVLLLHPEALAGAILLRAMPPLTAPPPADLAGTPVLLLAGAADPIIPAAKARLLGEQLETRGARLTSQTLAAGHGLTQADVSAAQRFYADLAAGASNRMAID